LTIIVIVSLIKYLENNYIKKKSYVDENVLYSRCCMFAVPSTQAGRIKTTETNDCPPYILTLQLRWKTPKLSGTKKRKKIFQAFAEIL